MIKTKPIITLLGIGTAISLLGDATLYTVLPHPSVAAQVGVKLSMVGILLGANRAVRLLLNGPVGLLYDRLPRRPLLITSLSVGALSSVLYALGKGFWPLFAGRIMWGLAWSLLWIGGNAVVLDISQETDRGQLSGRYQMWFILGVASSSLLGGLMTDLVGFRNGQWISALLIGLAALLWFFLFPETRGDMQSQTPESTKRMERVPIPWGTVLATSLPIFFARFIGWGVLAATAILWLSDLIGEGMKFGNIYIPIATLTGIYTAITMLTSIGSAPASGFFSDLIGRRWPVLAITAFLGAIGIWLMSTRSIPMAFALAGAMLVPVVGGGVETLVPAIIGDRVSDESRGRALGITNIFGDLGATVGPAFALGMLNLEWLSLGEIYRIGAILLAGVGLFALLQAKERPESDPIEKP
ncbi:MAG: MFS transporter [Anaerolineales bacterium]|nr:MFS transporter [Chloroflexota bacterium]MBL6983596.1 MFS transporter [Anaerolineales bacterium]